MDQKLTNQSENFPKDLARASEVRVQVVNKIVEDTHRMLDGFREKREEMSRELGGILAKNENLRKKDFGKMMENIVLTQRKREENVKQMLANFREEEEVVEQNFRLLLNRGGQVRIQDLKKALAKIQEEQKRREHKTASSVVMELTAMQKEVGGMLATFKKERELMASEWQNVMILLSQKRGLQDARINDVHFPIA